MNLKLRLHELQDEAFALLASLATTNFGVSARVLSDLTNQLVEGFLHVHSALGRGFHERAAKGPLKILEREEKK
jgi:hypothetical protein